MAKITPPMRNMPTASQPTKSYKYIAVIFVILACLLILGVSYLALSKVTITLMPSDDKLAHEFDLLIDEQAENNTSTDVLVPGKVVVKRQETEGQFFVESDKQTEAPAEGEVTIYNDRGVEQTLIATTRLLTPDGILFRLKDKVSIPAKSTQRAKIHADVKGASGNISPSTFTIPGLSESMQTQVYAKSDSSMVGGMRTIGILQASDLEKAEKELREKGAEKTLEAFMAQLDNKQLSLIGSQFDLTKVEQDKEAGEEVDSFTLSGELNVSAVYADREDILNMAREKIKEAQGPRGEFVNVDPASLEYEIVGIDEEAKQAMAHIKVEGLLTLDPAKDIFDKNLLVGFTEEDLRLYFSQFESIKDIQVKFSPFWVKKVPILRDHILIEIAE